MTVERETVIKVLAGALKKDIRDFEKIDDHESLNIYGLDSINGIELIVMLETEFNIAIEDDDLLIQNFNTLVKLIALVEKYVN